MEVRTFRASSLQEALRQVRETLGPDASVLHTREIKKSRLGLFSRSEIEVEASLDVPIASRFANGSGLQGNASDTNALRESNSSIPAHAQSSSTQPRTVSPESQASPESQTPPESQAAPSDRSPSSSMANPSVTSASTSSASMTGQGLTSASLSAQPPNRIASDGSAGVASQPQVRRSSPSMISHNSPQIATQPVSKASAPSTLAGISTAAMDIMSDMLDFGIDARLAKELLLEATERCRAEDREDPWLVQVSLNQSVAKRLNVSGSIEIDADDQKVVALVGSTGVGKTTTLAKIAAGFRFDLGCQIGLITLDTFRLGAVDQLLQYAELISAPLEVVSSPDEVTAALGRLRECDLVLLDTAGRSPRDAGQLQVLAQFLERAQPDSTHLVVSAGSSRRHIEDTLTNFAVVQPTNLLISKLDEAVDFGAWLPVLCESRLPVSYLTTGQHVPQDIVVASPRRLARELLGGDLRHQERSRQEAHLHRNPIHVQA